MKPRKISLHPRDMSLLKDYCELMGYELREVGGLLMLKDPQTHKQVILQRDHGRFIVVRDEAFRMNASGDIKVEEIVEDITDNIKLANQLKVFDKNPVRKNIQVRRFLKTLLEIKSLDIIHIPS